MRRRRPGSAQLERPRPAGLFGLLLLALAAAGCNTGSYPLDIFPEMHYQAWHRPLEPERLTAPADSVPIDGAAPRLTFEQAGRLANPLPASPDNLSRAAQVYAINCASCHGAAGDGRGPVAPYFTRGPAAVVPPPDFSSRRVRARSDGQLYWIVRHGLGNMPPYDNLLSDADLWATVLYIRQVQDR